jgi:hypothetical protein
VYIELEFEWKTGMGRPNKLVQLMNTKLPTKSEFNKKLYRPSNSEVQDIFAILNKNIFGNDLAPVDIVLKRIHMAYGWCEGRTDANGTFYTHEIKMSPIHGCLQWFATILAHEMVHHWQWSIYSNERYEQGLSLSKAAIMSHGPSFYKWKKPLEKYGIPLNTGYN